MARRILIDTDTYTGYNYLMQQYYVTNKGLTTYRDTATEIKRVLDIVAPDNTVTIEKLNTLASQLELLTPENEEDYKLYYTLSDTGSHIATIQIKDYADYPLTLDVEAQKLYIKNTNLVFDLTLNEHRNNRITIIQSYYKEHLGLSLTFTQLNLLYEFLINTYKPYVYNIILDTITTPLKFSNSFACSNWNNRGKATYQCDVNPNNTYTLSNPVARITEVNSSTNAITLSNSIPETLSVGSTIVVQNATTVLDTYTYSADGTYTIASVDTNTNTIYTTETISGSYEYNYPVSSLITSSVNLTNIDRDTSTITLTELVPNSIQVGDVIYISGTQQEVEGETVTSDGEYIVGSISSNTITLQSQPNTNYVYTEGTYPTVSKRLYIGNVQTIEEAEENVYNITLTTTPEQTLSENAHVVLVYNNTETYYSINSIEDNTITCTYMSGTLTKYEVNYPTISLPVPSRNILISVTSTTNEKVLPEGEFMVDDFEQCQQYLGLLTGVVVPTNEVYSLVNQEIPHEITIAPYEFLPKAEFIGLYSQVYGE